MSQDKMYARNVSTSARTRLLRVKSPQRNLNVFFLPGTTVRLQPNQYAEVNEEALAKHEQAYYALIAGGLLQLEKPLGVPMPVRGVDLPEYRPTPPPGATPAQFPQDSAARDYNPQRPLPSDSGDEPPPEDFTMPVDKPEHTYPGDHYGQAGVDPRPLSDEDRERLAAEKKEREERGEGEVDPHDPNTFSVQQIGEVTTNQTEERPEGDTLVEDMKIQGSVIPLAPEGTSVPHTAEDGKVLKQDGQQSEGSPAVSDARHAGDGTLPGDEGRGDRQDQDMPGVDEDGDKLSDIDHVAGDFSGTEEPLEKDGEGGESHAREQRERAEEGREAAETGESPADETGDEEGDDVDAVQGDHGSTPDGQKAKKRKGRK